MAVSRRAVVRYYHALVKAKANLIAELEAMLPGVAELPDSILTRHSPRPALLVAARPHLARLRTLEFAPVISGSNNDDPDWKQWSDPAAAEARIARFKRPLIHSDPAKADPLAFLIVKSMLLTGFDAPVEQVMYLDRNIREAELLQAIARVNRTHDKTKTAGLVVDYYGVARHLREALDAYDGGEVDGALQSLGDEVPRLRDRHFRTVELFRSRGVDDVADAETCVELLRDERLRAEFQIKLKQFLSTLDLILPRPEALPYVNDAKQLSYIQVRARNRYRDDARPIGKDVGAKVRQLIDEYVLSLGIDPKIPPVSLTDVHFAEAVDKARSPRSKASEMEHALRYHIRQHQSEDPEHYRTLSDRLDEILAELKGRWEELVEALAKLVKQAQAGRQQDDTGLDPVLHAPFFHVLNREVPAEAAASDAGRQALVALTVELVDHIRTEIGHVDFWSNAGKQMELQKWLTRQLDNADHLIPFEAQEAVADRLMELAKANHHRLT